MHTAKGERTLGWPTIFNYSIRPLVGSMFDKIEVITISLTSSELVGAIAQTDGCPLEAAQCSVSLMN